MAETSAFFKKMLFGRVLRAEKGKITTFGTMNWTLYPARSMALTLQEIGKKKGPAYLFKLGYTAGRDFTEEISRSLKLQVKSSETIPEVVTSLTEFTGFGILSVVRWNVNKSGHHSININLEDNPVIEHAKNLYGANSMVCSFFMGIFSAKIETLTYAKRVKFVESKCLCKGNPFCKWESKW